ncbi:MAG: hypothetical protein K9N06_09465 [Candidatus Cloacimonetes bacterium]|nr:hypothetical protein [Candidatus Cloacimonadota bacterium]
MQNYEEILDNDELLKKLGWEEYFQLVIHYPEQVLTGFMDAYAQELNTSGINTVYFLNPASQFDILYIWLKIICQDKFEFVETTDYPVLKNQAAIVKPSYTFDKNSIKQSITITAMQDGNKDEIYLDLSHIRSLDGNCALLGGICGLLDQLSGIDFLLPVRSLVALLMHKAGALTWRVPFERNFAKGWAVRLYEKGLRYVTAGNVNDYAVIAAEWEKLLRNAGVDHGDQVIHLRSRLSLEEQATNAKTIFGDGKTLLEEAVTLYQLGVITGIYCAILNNKKKEE